MVILKNNVNVFETNELFQLFLRNKETDCFLYSKEGTKFYIHSEVLYQTKLTRNILRSANDICCKGLEIFCPCSAIELKSIIDFLYSGRITYQKENEVANLQDNLKQIFGFPKNLSLERDYLLLQGSQESGIKAKFETLHEDPEEILEQNRESNWHTDFDNSLTDPISIPNSGNEGIFFFLMLESLN